MSQTGCAGTAVYGAVPCGLRRDGPRSGMCSGSQTSCVTAATQSTVFFPPLMFPTHYLVKLMAMALARLSTEVLASV